MRGSDACGTMQSTDPHDDWRAPAMALAIAPAALTLDVVPGGSAA
jgi:hypothetical protein